MTSLGMAVEDVEHVGATVAGVVTARVLRTERTPTPRKVHRVYVDAGDGVERHVWCGAFNMQAGDVVPLAVIGTTMPDGRTIERRGILGIDSEGMLCSARELGLGDDHAGILILPPDSAARRAVRRRRSVSSPTSCSTSTSPATGRTAGATSASPATSPPTSGSSSACPPPALAGTGEERRADVEIVAGDRCGRFTSTVMLGHRGRPVGGVDAAPPHRGRDATDQQRRRRQQLRDARAQPAEPRLRPRHARLRPAAGVPHPAGGRRGDDDDARRRRADVHRRRSADLRRRRPCRSASPA